jgi:hypothetical protein
MEILKYIAWPGELNLTKTRINYLGVRGQNFLLKIKKIIISDSIKIGDFLGLECLSPGYWLLNKYKYSKWNVEHNGE